MSMPKILFVCLFISLVLATFFKKQMNGVRNCVSFISLLADIFELKCEVNCSWKFIVVLFTVFDSVDVGSSLWSIWNCSIVGACVNQTDKKMGEWVFCNTLHSVSTHIYSIVVDLSLIRTKWPPLMVASDKGHAELVKILLADPICWFWLLAACIILFVYYWF